MDRSVERQDAPESEEKRDQTKQKRDVGARDDGRLPERAHAEAETRTEEVDDQGARQRKQCDRQQRPVNPLQRRQGEDIEADIAMHVGIAVPERRSVSPFRPGFPRARGTRSDQKRQDDRRQDDEPEENAIADAGNTANLTLLPGAAECDDKVPAEDERGEQCPDQERSALENVSIGQQRPAVHAREPPPVDPEAARNGDKHKDRNDDQQGNDHTYGRSRRRPGGTTSSGTRIACI